MNQSTLTSISYVMRFQILDWPFESDSKTKSFDIIEGEIKI